MIRPVKWMNGTIELIDQTVLPDRLVMLTLEHVHEVADAIRQMKVRGAPAIGVAGAFGVALVAHHSKASTAPMLLEELELAGALLKETRPTAVNLAWAIDRMLHKARLTPDRTSLASAMVEEAIAIFEEDLAMGGALGKQGVQLVPDGGGVLTHCNTGALATAGAGTALGVLRSAWESGKRFHVWVDETRPLLQGSRLTAWELQEMKIPYTLITDGMAAAMMAKGRIQMAIVGADRIAANGDTANKIGTYQVAISCRYHGIPFYVAAPTSTIDPGLADGSSIPIEERRAEEVTVIGGRRMAPAQAAVANPAFDVTPHPLITGIVTEKGIAKSPFTQTLPAMVAQHALR